MPALIGLLVMLAAGAAPGAEVVVPVTRIVGTSFAYRVRQGETLTTIGARLGVPVATLRWLNARGARAALHAGDTIVVDHRHIVVLDPAAPLLLNVAQRMIFLTADGLTSGYPVAVGLPTWPTPRGRFTVVEKEANPTWDVPPSIQAEMREQGKPVVTRVPPGQDNPLGAYFIRLSFSNIGIHGTPAPGSIFRAVSHGCIRMHPEDIAALFPRTGVGTAGLSIYEPALLAVDAGRVYVEVHPDVYRRASDPLTRLRALAGEHSVSDRIDWAKVATEIRQQRGIAIDVTAS
jgi:L,D-transpeptidase ErfK/SrfK